MCCHLCVEHDTETYAAEIDAIPTEGMRSQNHNYGMVLTLDNVLLCIASFVWIASLLTLLSSVCLPHDECTALESGTLLYHEKLSAAAALE